ncbi:MAG: hypothetical protein ACTIC1_20240, partial [Brevibacterium sp.]
MIQTTFANLASRQNGLCSQGRQRLWGINLRTAEPPEPFRSAGHDDKESHMTTKPGFTQHDPSRVIRADRGTEI